MIVGGRADGAISRDKVYALSLDPAIQVPTCLHTICDYPITVYSPRGALFDDNVPTFCSGINSNDGHSVHNECYKYNYTSNLWGNGTRGSIPSGYKNYFAAAGGLAVFCTNVELYQDTTMQFQAFRTMKTGALWSQGAGEWGIL